MQALQRLVAPVDADGAGAGAVAGFRHQFHEGGLVQLGFDQYVLPGLDVDAHHGDQFGILL